MTRRALPPHARRVVVSSGELPAGALPCAPPSEPFEPGGALRVSVPPRRRSSLTSPITERLAGTWYRRRHRPARGNVMTRRVVRALVVVAAAMVLVVVPAAGASSAPQRLGYCGGDDWEPATAVQGANVYVAITHYLGDTSCDPASGSPAAIYLQTSTNRGRTFGAPHAVWTQPVGGTTYPEQADPSVAVDAAGNVYVSFLGLGRKRRPHRRGRGQVHRPRRQLRLRRQGQRQGLQELRPPQAGRRRRRTSTSPTRRPSTTSSACPGTRARPGRRPRSMRPTWSASPRAA